MTKTFIEAVQLPEFSVEREMEIETRLKENYTNEDLLNLCREAYQCGDDTFDFVDVFDAEEIEDYFSGGMYQLMCAIVHGDVNTTSHYLRFNAYMNLESVDEIDLETEAEDYIDELVSWVIDNWDEAEHILNEEDYRLLAAWYEIDNDEDYLEELLEELKEE